MTFARLRDEVVRAGLCMFCGSCAGVCPGRHIKMNYETEEPEAVGECPSNCNICSEICPGRDIPMPEMEKMLFGRERSTTEIVGIAQQYVKVHAMDTLVRNGGASGGLVSALIIFALENGIIDAALVAGNSEKQPWRAEAKIVTNKKEVMNTQQTKLCASPNNSLLNEALSKGFRKLAVVGLPCQIHALRKMQLAGKSKKIVNSIQFNIGLLCGSNWNHKAVEHTIEELSRVPLSEVAKLKCREGAYPSMYTVFDKDGRRVVLPDAARRFHNAGFWKNRCIVCRDYTADLADISAGDYWGPEMVPNAEKMSSAIIRTDIGRKIMAMASEARAIIMSPIGEELFPVSPSWELKNHCAAYHIAERRKFGWPTPDYHWPVDYPEPIPSTTTFEPHPHI